MLVSTTALPRTTCEALVKSTTAAYRALTQAATLLVAPRGNLLTASLPIMQESEGLHAMTSTCHCVSDCLCKRS